MKAVYSVGVASNAAETDLAKDFVERFKTPSARLLLATAGYELNG
jgi:ABC-type molybdate transport system substrate-binding protein